MWFSLVNTASHFAGGRNHISLHFGYSIAKNTMLRRLNDMYTYPDMVVKSKATLNRFKTFVIVIFDNSQFNIKKKFQQNTMSSNMAKATCCLFLEPTLFDYVDSIPNGWSELGNIPITYLDQVIPSPYGMPPFERLSQDWSVSELCQDTFSTFEELIDESGVALKCTTTWGELLDSTSDWNGFCLILQTNLSHILLALITILWSLTAFSKN